MPLSQTVIDKFKRIDELPTLPPIAMKVNFMLQDMDTSVKSLSETIANDQAIASKILKLVNSAFFGLSSKVGNIRHALTLLGFNTVRNAVVAVSILKVFPNDKKDGAFDVKAFWKHSIAVAVMCRYLAHKSRLHSPDDAFMGGLLHDIGKFVLFCYFREDFLRVWERVKEKNCTFREAEKIEIGFCHDRTGAFLAKKWKLPEHLSNAILYHHAINKNQSKSYLPLLVHTANIISNQWDASDYQLKKYMDLSPEATKVLGNIIDKESTWHSEIKEDIEKACHVFLEV